MKKCVLCGKGKASEALRVCVDCIRTSRGNTIVKERHKQIRAEYCLPAEPPKSEGGIRCDLCSNECKLIAEEFFENSAPPVLTATTLLVPFYVDDKEVENIGNKQLLF